MPLDTHAPPRLRRACPQKPLIAGKYFYGVRGTPFIDAAEAWYWTLDCLEARELQHRSSASIKIGRPCEPDDIVNAMARLELPPVHARTVTSWGKRRVVPPEGTERRRLWDEVMDRLSPVLVAKGIVRAPVPIAGRRARDLALMEVPLMGLERALAKLGAAVAEREARPG